MAYYSKKLRFSKPSILPYFFAKFSGIGYCKNAKSQYVPIRVNKYISKQPRNFLSFQVSNLCIYLRFLFDLPQTGFYVDFVLSCFPPYFFSGSLLEFCNVPLATVYMPWFPELETPKPVLSKQPFVQLLMYVRKGVFAWTRPSAHQSVNCC